MTPTSDKTRKLRPFALLLLAGLDAALVASLATHPLPEAHAATPAPAPKAEASGEARPSTPAPRPETRAVTNTASASASIAAIATAPKPAGRPLRVVGMGWELLAPGLLANDGLAPGEASRFREAGVEVEFAAVLHADELEARLARGGAVDEGADVAILPLPTFVASYEQLRALSPEVFFVVGWSAGRDAIAAEDRELLVDGRARRDLKLIGAPGQPATLLGLFALDGAGLDIDELELVAPHSEAAQRAGSARVEAVERSLSTRALHPVDSRELVLNSADAPELIPWVAVAPAGYIEGNTEELARFAEVWLDGADQLAADVPGAARRVAAEDGAPEAVALLELMAYVRFAELADSARLAGLSGRGAVNIESLFHRSWSLWRAVGVLSTPAPEHAPLASEVVARVALGEVGVEPRRRPTSSSARDGQRLVLLRRFTARELDAEQEAVIEEIGFLAGSFARGEIELRLRGDRRTRRAGARLIDEAVERYDLDPDHVRVGPRLRGARGPAAELRVRVP